jgi:hypothetical protein
LARNAVAQAFRIFGHAAQSTGRGIADCRLQIVGPTLTLYLTVMERRNALIPGMS